MPATKSRASLASKLLIFAGMPRTGSTSLFHILGKHPGIFRPFRKEVGYFLFNRHKGERWYLDAYADASAAQRCIDVTPEYFFDAGVPERIREFGEGVRVVIGVRDPAEFAVSLHAEYAKRYAIPPLDDFVQHYEYHRGSATISFSLRDGVIRRMIDLYRTTFGAKLLLYDYAAFGRNPLPILQCIERHAGLEPHFRAETFTNIRMNARSRPTRRWLSRILSAEPLIDTASSLLPSSMLHSIARKVYGGDRNKVVPATTIVPESIKTRLEADRRFIADLFGGNAVVDGTGETRLGQARSSSTTAG